MRKPTSQPATYEDLLALPPNMVGEIIDGELHAHPRPASPHAYTSSGLGALLLPGFQHGSGGPGGWWILDEPQLKLGRDILVPDLEGWRKARMPSIPKVPQFELAPDWVCEILSPSTASIDRVAKKHIYARERVSYLWYLDPAAQTLEVLTLRDGQWVELGAWMGAEKVRAAPFDALELDLSLLWIAEESE